MAKNKVLRDSKYKHH